VPKAQMAASAPQKKVAYEKFRGVDFAANPGEVDETRSPDALNMISDQSGRPVKRFGYEMVAKTPDMVRVNGMFKLVKPEGQTLLLHAGTKLFAWNPDAPKARIFSFSDIRFADFIFSDDPFDPDRRGGMTQIYADMADRRSMAFQMDGKLWIVDGKALLCWDGSTVMRAQDMAYVPTTVISSTPGGGGENYEDRNMLSPQAVNSFVVSSENQDITTFQLDTRKYDSVVKAEKLNLDGGWDDITSTVIAATAEDKRDGKVRFSTAPGASVIQGEDNVRITFSKMVEGTAEKINGCRFGIMWGIGGANRLVLSGNPDYPNMDFTSEITKSNSDAPTYFPENKYSLVGQDATAIVGYMRYGEDLAILKQASDQDATIFLRKGTLTEDAKPFFTLKESVAGVGALTPHCMTNLRDDPVFLSEEGVFALSTSSITGWRGAQARSELVNNRLRGEANLEDAVAVEFGGYLHLAVNGHVYVADAAQRTYQGKTAEQFQYEWYYWEGVPARVWFKHDGKLWFGTETGEIYRFYSKKESASYSDCGRPIRAYWTTPEIPFDTYSVYKTLKRLYSKITPYSRSSVRVWLKEEGGFELLDEKQADIFSFDDIDLNRLTFNTDRDVGVIATKVKAKRVVTTQVRLENNALNEAFGITGITIYYETKGKVK